MEKGMKANRLIKNSLLTIVALFVLLYECTVFSTEIVCGPEENAGHSPIFPDNFPSSPNLCGVGGIMDMLYSIPNPSNPEQKVPMYQRIPDLKDQKWMWSPSERSAIEVRVIAKFSGFDDTLKDSKNEWLIHGDSFNGEYFPQLSVDENGKWGTAPIEFKDNDDDNDNDIDMVFSSEFVFTLLSGVSQLEYFSDSSQNVDFFDHMVTFAVTGGIDNTLISDLGLKKTYVMAWEDQLGGGDRDYNDLVIEVAYVNLPEPSSTFLIIIALPCLLFFTRKIIFQEQQRGLNAH
jgi:hypothetical protein